jgi:4-carboxymuconolactone decarboxylase
MTSERRSAFLTPRPQRIVGQTPEQWSAETRVLFDAVVPAAGGAAKPVTLPSVIAQHPTYLAPYLGWAKAIALRGVLPPRANALLTLRTAWHCDSGFEWAVHARSAPLRGALTADEVARVLSGHDDPAWAPLDSLLLQAADQLCTQHGLTDETYAALAEMLEPAALLEVAFVVGHYTMLSLVANLAGVPPVA